jgi:mycofactocin precursor
VQNSKEKMEEHQTEKQSDDKKDAVFQIEEVTIEEMAIDGICGVY